MRESPASRAGRTAGMADGLSGNLRGARSSFMRASLPESDWPAYREAYNAAVASESRRMRSVP